MSTYWWLVELSGGIVRKIGSNKEPKDPAFLKVIPIPDNLKDEEERWLKIESNAAALDSAKKTTEQADDAAKDAHKALVDAKIRRQEFGKVIHAEVGILNDGLSWTTTQTAAFLADTTIQSLMTLALAGSLATLKESIVAADLTAYYTAPQKQGIVDLIQNYLDSE